MMKKIVITLLFLLLTIALLFGVWYLLELKGWPLWVGLSIVAGFVSIVLLFVFLRRYFLRNNERKFVKRVIAQEGEQIFATAKESTLLLNDLEAQWEKSIQKLYGSNLSKKENPIYALPWILFIGESGAGKTSLIKNSRLASAMTDVEASAQYAGTKNCDWWFFENAIILDTAGRYSIPLEDKRDNAEWERFLSLLTKYRKKEPLNGIVVTISAERLLENDKDLIQEDALSIRKRIDQLMISIGAKFPVYLMVSKMDHVYGFSDFCSALPEELQNQAMGYLNESLEQDWEKVVEEGSSFVKQKLISLQLLSIEHNEDHAAEILLFSKEFDKIIPALKDFSSIVFGENPYQKIPMFRGIYFSSALDDGSSNSQFLSDFNLTQKEQHPNNKACFIADFFKVILPHDRTLFVPIQEYLTWQRKNYKIALSMWILFFGAVFGIYTYSYMHNINVISDVKSIEKYNYNDDFTQMDLGSRIYALDKLRMDILKIEKLNREKSLPLLEFQQSKKAEIKLKKLFYEKFNDYLYKEFFAKINASISKINEDTPSKTVVSYIGFLIDSIDLSKQVLQKKSEITTSPYFAKWIQNILFGDNTQLDPSLSYLFVKNYIAFEMWNQDENLIKEQIKVFQNLIDLIVDKKGPNLHWLTDEGVTQTPSITMKNFFKNIDDKELKNFPVISGSLTQQGRENLINNVNILMREMKNATKLKKNLTLFWQWYDKRFYYRWKNFAMRMNDVEKLLKPRSDEKLLYSMTSEDNPYFEFIHTMAKELQAYKSPNKTPQWAKLAIEIDAVISLASEIRNSKNSLLADVEKKTDTFLAKAQQSVDKNVFIKRIKAAENFNNYFDDLSKLSIVADTKQSKALIKEFFSENASTNKQTVSFNQCHDHYKKFIHSLPYYANSNFIYKLVEGPKDYIIHYSIYEMDKAVNKAWQSDVLAAMQYSSDDIHLLESLFDKKKGLVWRFIKNELQAFVVLNQYGYSVKQLDGYKLDITPRFIHYINSGINLLSAYKPEYQIKITTLPFDVNKDAKLEPNYVDLHLECAQTDTILKNENYTLSKTFHWIPGKCGDTTITFGFNTFSVQKVYKGPRGFLLFLKDFQDGTKVFSMKEYTKSAPELKQYNVKYVKVSYNISNEGNILKLLDKTPYNVPKTVTKEE